MRCPKGFLAASLALLLGGCSAEKRESAAAVSDAVAAVEKTGIQAAQNESDEALLKQKLARRSREVGRLQLQLLAKQAEINQLLSAHERALQEAVRAGAKLRGLDTRADAVAAIAEAALMIRNAKERARDDQQQALVHADKLLESSRREMKSGNLNAASYLAFMRIAEGSSVCRPMTLIVVSDGVPEPWSSQGGTKAYTYLRSVRRLLGVPTYVVAFTEEVYAVHFEGDLSQFGLESPFIVPSSSSGTVCSPTIDEISFSLKSSIICSSSR